MDSPSSPARLVRDNGEADRHEKAPQLPEIPADAPYCFRGRNILMLQGPVGPFFARLAQDLRWVGANIHKINFNGGDWFYFPRGASSFTDSIEKFPRFLERVCEEKRIDTIMLFGDCRTMHSIASEIAEAHGIEVYVFEEGYIRPDYITMERFGVNGRSAMPRAGIFYLNSSAPEPAETSTVGQSIWHATGWAFTYYFWAIILWPFFPRYRHHRPLSWFEGLAWVQGAARKYWYRLKNRPDVARLTAESHPPFFLVPLQVHNDAQIGVHSVFDTVEQFIRHTTLSFTAHAPKDALLVFKHHPMDRPYTDYTRLIRKLRAETGLGDRLIYVHDPHLPTLLNRATGIVTINSTTGMSAIHHGKPTLALGNAIYRIDGLTAATTLDQFWTRALDFPVHVDLYKSFRHHLIYRTQINGNFYRRINIPGTLAGIDWSRGQAKPGR
ncbi:capsule biosynthesis protein [Parasphingopyxis marina]|uniref:Capsular biosynthesis protein n=1 Tax=Parasphingopyxis marina TaxID=2761622 RepID=A0A842I315_9SPHN|nr:capsular biosynthesis protein [Parasphingopyxis marina]MBC2778294.1 capsular biosynthesis protein [Parasphingopyxis marina]